MGQSYKEPATPMPQIEIKSLPSAKAVRFFRNKGFAISFDWREIGDSE